MTGVFAALSDVGKRRSMNQDRVLAEDLGEGWTLLVVADGVGGAHGGELASTEALEAVQSAFRGASVASPAGEIVVAMEAANARVCRLQLSDERLKDMATTLVVALAREDEAWVASLGDSRAYTLEGGELRMVTEDDSYVADMVRRGVLNEEAARSHPYQNVITRGIGVEEDVSDVEVIQLALAPGAMLLLCTDGLFRAVEEPEIALVMRQGDVHDITRELVGRANANGGPDNIGVVVYRRPVDLPTE